MAVPVGAEAAAPDRVVGDVRADDRPVARLDGQRQAVGPPQLEPDLNLLRPAPAHRREDLLVDLGREDRAADELQVLGDRKGRGGASEETQDEQGRHEPRHARAILWSGARFQPAQGTACGAVIRTGVLCTPVRLNRPVEWLARFEAAYEHERLRILATT